MNISINIKNKHKPQNKNEHGNENKIELNWE